MNEINKDNIPAKDQLDDILADTEEDKSYNTVPVASSNQSSVAPETIEYGENGMSLEKIRKYLIIFAVIILVVGAAGAGYYWRNAILLKANQYLDLFTKKSQPADITNVQNIQTTETKPATKTPSISPVNTNITPASKDTDHDGLADDEEKKLGTNLNNADSDSDGLYDNEEVKIYKTDPLDPDTNNNGIKDGDEVKMKLNPRGTGPLNKMQ